MSNHVHSDGCCSAAVIKRAEGECRRCIGGTITLPGHLYDPAELACPWCQPQEYPDGFPGVKALPESHYDHWLIPPGAGA